MAEKAEGGARPAFESRMVEATWTEGAPPDLPPAPLPGRVIGGFRLVAFLLATAILFPGYAVARGLDAVTGLRTRERVQQVWSWVGARLCGITVRRTGRAMRHGGAMVSNHVSWSDIVVLRSSATLDFVSKAEVRSWPVIGYIAHFTGTVFIERKRSLAKAHERELHDHIAAGRRLMFFPEGTSTDGRQVLPFKSTLFSVFMTESLREDVWVQPVSVVYFPNPRSGLPREFYGWWGEMPFGGHAWDVLTRSFGATAEVVFHEPVRAADFPERKALAAYCEAKVREGVESRI